MDMRKKRKKKKGKKSVKWDNYEQVTEQLLKDIKELLRLSKIESKKIIKGDATEWEIEVSAIDAVTAKLVLVECKCWSKAVDQETMGGFAYRIRDVKAGRGIIVTTKGLQKGAKRIAEKEKIASIILRIDSDIDNYIAEFINKIFVKRTNVAPKVEMKMEIKSVKEVKVELSGLSTEADLEVN